MEGHNSVQILSSGSEFPTASLSSNSHFVAAVVAAALHKQELEQESRVDNSHSVHCHNSEQDYSSVSVGLELTLGGRCFGQRNWLALEQVLS